MLLLIATFWRDFVTMTTADQLALVNKLLQPPEEAHTLAQVSLSLSLSSNLKLCCLFDVTKGFLICGLFETDRLVVAKNVHYYNFNTLQAGLVIDWVKSRRLLVLVRQGREQSLFVLTCQQYPVTSVGELTIDTVLPLDNSFKFDLDSAQSSGPDAVYVTVTSQRSVVSQPLLLSCIAIYHYAVVVIQHSQLC